MSEEKRSKTSRADLKEFSSEQYIPLVTPTTSSFQTQHASLLYKVNSNLKVYHINHINFRYDLQSGSTTQQRNSWLKIYFKKTNT